MRLFVTGGTGFIGAHLLPRLTARGHSVCCLARPTSNLEVPRRVGADVVVGDLGDRTVLRRGMEGCDCVIHAAALYDFWVPDRSAYRRVNVEGTRNVMESALEEAVAKVVLVSTVGVWAGVKERHVTEATPVGPVRIGDYFESKYQAEQIAWELSQSRGLPLVVVYPGAVIGPDDPKASGDYIRRLVQHRLPATVFDGTPFPFVHVDDVAEGILRAVEKPGNIGERYILNKHNPTFGEINSLVSDISGTPLPRLHLPDWATMVTARLLSTLADATKRPPLLGMAADQMRCMKDGLVADGAKVERELGLTYTPLRTCLEDAVMSVRTRH